MSEPGEQRRVITRASVILAVVVVGAIGVTIPTLYGAAFDAESARLAEVVAGRAALIESIARFEAVDGPTAADRDAARDWRALTLARISEAHQRFEGFGETGELTLARREGDRIVFLLSHRHDDAEVPRPVAWDSHLAEPMRRALRGETGVAIAPDYRDARVLAAYQPLPELGWGLVAKIDLAEVRAPFVRTGILAGAIGLLLAGAGAVLLERGLSPLLRRMDERMEQRVEAEHHEREVAEELSRDNLSLTQAILDTAVDAIVTIDHAGQVLSANRAAAAMFGYDEDELVGLNVRILMPEPYRREHDAHLEAYARTGQRKIIGIGREVPCLRKDGRVFPGDLAVSEVKLDDGRVLFTGVMRDLSERKRSELQLLQAEQRVQAAEELASVGTLVAGLAHEIGTPMGVIQGHARLLEKHLAGQEKAEWRLKTIQEQIGRISKIIQSLLNMARPKATDRIPVALEPLLENTLSFLSEKFKRRNVRVVRDFEPTGSVTGDPERLQQLLLNLFLNAVDAMPEGGELRIRLRPGRNAGACLDVADTGVGIAPEDLPRIFDAFYTSKEAGKGNGLGLNVANRIVADHGGTIEVESTPSEGTAFHIHLPWNPTYRSQSDASG